jgi:BetI-type transcriptional repressor, C-terminal
VEGQESGEFGPVNPADFAVALSALLDGFAIQIALEDPTVDAGRAYELTMRFAAMELGFSWVRRHRVGEPPDTGKSPAGAGAARGGAKADR